VFPDTTEGIQNALKRGANVLWLNTVLYKNHPIENVFVKDIYFVGQMPKTVDVYDNKLITNRLLKSNNIPIPTSEIIRNGDFGNMSLVFPLVLKPIRGRGSQGVFKIDNDIELVEKLEEIFAANIYGNTVYVEHYLIGQEITITVLPPGSYEIEKQIKYFDKPWCLPAVKRFNHKNGIAPYSGVVAVTQNSQVLDDAALNSEEIQMVYQHCIKAAELIGIKAPIRIDCRANEKGQYFLFDLNLKPNMTGPSRSHRKNQDSLTLLAAKKIGWNYFDLLNNILGQKWNLKYNYE
jgi:carbamoylphosphate synthase large subunit